jgi:hypothetical protein
MVQITVMAKYSICSANEKQAMDDIALRWVQCGSCDSVNGRGYSSFNPIDADLECGNSISVNVPSFHETSSFLQRPTHDIIASIDCVSANSPFPRGQNPCAYLPSSFAVAIIFRL